MKNKLKFDDLINVEREIRMLAFFVRAIKMPCSLREGDNEWERQCVIYARINVVYCNYLKEINIFNNP